MFTGANFTASGAPGGIILNLLLMMDYPGVISGQNALLDKLDAFRHLTLDGHCPGLWW